MAKLYSLTSDGSKMASSVKTAKEKLIETKSIANIKYLLRLFSRLVLAVQIACISLNIKWAESRIVNKLHVVETASSTTDFDMGGPCI